MSIIEPLPPSTPSPATTTTPPTLFTTTPEIAERQPLPPTQDSSSPLLLSSLSAASPPLPPPPPPPSSPSSSSSAQPQLPMPIPMPLLTHSESLAFDGIFHPSQYGVHSDAVQVHGHQSDWSKSSSQQLTRATKDLLALENSQWASPQNGDAHYYSQPSASYNLYPSYSNSHSNSHHSHSQPPMHLPQQQQPQQPHQYIQHNHVHSQPHQLQHTYYQQSSLPPTPTVAYPMAPLVAPSTSYDSYNNNMQSQPQDFQSQSQQQQSQIQQMPMSMGMPMAAPHQHTPSPPHVSQQVASMNQIGSLAASSASALPEVGISSARHRSVSVSMSNPYANSGMNMSHKRTFGESAIAVDTTVDSAFKRRRPSPLSMAVIGSSGSRGMAYPGPRSAGPSSGASATSSYDSSNAHFNASTANNAARLTTPPRAPTMGMGASSSSSSYGYNMGSNMSGMGGMSLSLNIGTSLGASAKPALLSPSQKKANHIQSEQKRRANIRRGYDALCTAVPTLREAIAQQEKEEAMQRAEDAAVVAANGGRRPAQRRKRVKGAKEVIVKEEEKIDGRAGPKSEYVVLQKTIDYVVELQDEHQTLRERLAAARSALNLPTASAPMGDAAPVWEREWTGGSVDEDDSEDSD